MFEDIKTWSAEQIEERSAAIKAEIETADEAKLDELNNELTAIEERKKVIEMETRKENMKAVAEGAGVVLAKVEEKKEERTLDSVRSSAAYEDAFATYLKTGDDRECSCTLLEQSS